MSWASRTRGDRALWVASVCALGGLALMIWSVIVPTPFPVIVALSCGQLIGTTSFILYLLVVGADVRVRQRLKSSEDAKRDSTP